MIQIKLKALKGDSFELEASPMDSVAQLKQNIFELHPELTSQLKLIYAGRILEDSLKIKDVGIMPNFPMVVMPSKNKPLTSIREPTAFGQEPIEAIGNVPTNSITTNDVEAAPQIPHAPASIIAPETRRTPEIQTHVHEDMPVALTDFDVAMRQLCEMGFERGEVEQCLHLAYGNPDRAAEYLMSGIPSHLSVLPQSQDVGQHQAFTRDLETVSQLDSTQRIGSMHELIESTQTAQYALPVQAYSDWEVRTIAGWQPWLPGVPFQGDSGEEVRFMLGHHSYRATFQAGGLGIQTNELTGTRRPLRRRGANTRPSLAFEPGRGASIRPLFALEPGICGRDQLPPILAHELEFVVPGTGGFAIGQHVRSDSRTVGDFRFRLLVFPRGTNSSGGTQLSAFVEADPQEDIDGPDGDRWVFHKVKFQITLINWIDYRASVTKVDTWTFDKEGIDRGWHDLLPVEEQTVEKGWLGPDGSILLRASCFCRYAGSLHLEADYCSHKETGFLSWKSGESLPTSLLQSLGHINAFKSMMSQNQSESYHMRGGYFMGLLRDLFKTPNDQEPTTSLCDPGPSLQALGWHDIKSWGGKGPSELLADLCAALEISDVKKMFQVELKNYIECYDVDFESVCCELSYGFKLSLHAPCGRALGGVMESFRQMFSEEVLEGDNLYEAEGYGKQRAKKGVRISHLPPVLLLDLGRFSFDLGKMQEVFLGTKFEFPTKLMLTEFFSDASAYTLQTVISYDVGTKNYSAHIRPTSESGWVKYADDGKVVPCSEYAAVTSKYGGEELSLWNYFEKTPENLCTTSCPTRPRNEYACTLVYVQEITQGFGHSSD